MKSVAFVQAGTNINMPTVCVMFPIHSLLKPPLLAFPSPVGLLDVPGTRFAQIVAELLEEENRSTGHKLAPKHGDFSIDNMTEKGGVWFDL